MTRRQVTATTLSSFCTHNLSLCIIYQLGVAFRAFDCCLDVEDVLSMNGGILVAEFF